MTTHRTLITYLKMIKDKNQSWGAFLIETLLLIALVLFVRFYIFQFFRVSGPSMCPTLNVLNGECQYDKGEFIFVNEVLYNFIRDPKLGEIVVFNPPAKDDYYIKRIIGTPGDTVTIEEGKVSLTPAGSNQKIELPESYLSAMNQGQTNTFGLDEFVVPDDHFLLFGDNRAKSFDGRHCYNPSGCDGKHTPFIHKDDIQGRAQFIVWPLTKIRGLENELIDVLPE